MALTGKHQHLGLGAVPGCLSWAGFVGTGRQRATCEGALSFLGSLQQEQQCHRALFQFL